MGGAVLKPTFAGLVGCSVKKGRKVLPYRPSCLRRAILYTADSRPHPQQTVRTRDRRSLPRVTVPCLCVEFMATTIDELMALAVMTVMALALAWYVRILIH
jgi:hypothetical protein